MDKNKPKTKIFNFIFFTLCLLFVLYLISPSLNIFDHKLFDFHDDTQLTRVHEYVLNLKNGIFPPRLAPELSFNLGLPLYNFYAPFSYLVAGILVALGLTEIYALKIMFILSVIVAFAGMFYFLRIYFKFLVSILGATLYVTSTYFAVEIIVRGNLAECWFLALFPLSLSVIHKNAKSRNYQAFFFTSIILFFTLITHNLFSLAFIPLVLIYIFFQKNIAKNLLALFISVMLSSFFWLPVITETSYTHAKALAQDTKYQDHFLCAEQLWNTNGWHYGGSVPGCVNDQMSFRLGKIQTILASLGLITLLWQLAISKKQKNKKEFAGIAVLTLVSLFMTLYQSQFIWDALNPVLAIFQFPWRFLVFAMFGIAFLGAYFFNTIKIPLKSLLIILFIFGLFFIGKKYFGKPLYDPKTYTDKYASPKYIKTEAAYKVREYLTARADFNYWWQFNPEINPIPQVKLDYSRPIESKNKFEILENNIFFKKVSVNPGEIKINIHYFPFWQIRINNQNYTPAKFDQMGRPIINIDKPSIIQIYYQETLMEKLGNALTLIGFLILIACFLFWKSLQRNLLFNPIFNR